MSKTKSLLALAKSVEPGKRPLKEAKTDEIELALAFLNGEISARQLKAVLKETGLAAPTAYQSWCFTTIVKGARQGKIHIRLT